jgi:hypothetical protein
MSRSSRISSIGWTAPAAAGVHSLAQNAKDAIAAKAIEAGVVHGRITLWLWQAPNRVKVRVRHGAHRRRWR